MIHADVLVVGSGPAGFAAALTAARMGADTLLLEKESIPGGMATGGMLNVFCGYASSGVFEDMKRAVGHKDREGRMLYEPEDMLSYMIGSLREAGVRLLLDARSVGVARQNRKIDSIQIATRAGLTPARASMFVDASGDGQLAFDAGVPFELGDPATGVMQPMTMMVMLDDVENEEHVTFGLREDLQEKMRAFAKARGLGAAGHVILIPGPRKGQVVLNMTNCIGADATDPEAYTRAQLTCRAQVGPIIEFLRENMPGYEHCRLDRTAAYAGIRESRHFQGEYRLEAEDIRASRVFSDWCAAGVAGQINIHNTVGSGSDARSERIRTEYTIPLGCLRPKGLDNLLLAGRSISGSHLAHGSYRMMPICMAMGQGAGTVAALCARKGVAPAELEPREWQSELVAHGVTPPKGWTN